MIFAPIPNAIEQIDNAENPRSAWLDPSPQQAERIRKNHASLCAAFARADDLLTLDEAMKEPGMNTAFFLREAANGRALMAMIYRDKGEPLYYVPSWSILRPLSGEGPRRINTLAPVIAREFRHKNPTANLLAFSKFMQENRVWFSAKKLRRGLQESGFEKVFCDAVAGSSDFRDDARLDHSLRDALSMARRKKGYVYNTILKAAHESLGIKPEPVSEPARLRA